MSVGTNSRKDANTIRQDRDTRCSQNSGVLASLRKMAKESRNRGDSFTGATDPSSLTLSPFPLADNTADLFASSVFPPKYDKRHRGKTWRAVDTKKITLHGCTILFSSAKRIAAKSEKEAAFPNLAPVAR